MTFKCRFNATCFLFKINRFVLIFSKTSNRFVLKICSGGFADYSCHTHSAGTECHSSGSRKRRHDKQNTNSDRKGKKL